LVPTCCQAGTNQYFIFRFGIRLCFSLARCSSSGTARWWLLDDRAGRLFSHLPGAYTNLLNYLYAPQLVSLASLSATIRTHFGLTQAEPARFLGVSREQVTAVEAGRKEFSDAPRHRLWMLARQLPPPTKLGSVPPRRGSGSTY
jgi:DNA-binding XRE family transcriptional regulator